MLVRSMNARKRVLFVTARSLALHAIQSITQPKTGTMSSLFLTTSDDLSYGLKDMQGNPVRDLSVYQAEWNNSFEFSSSSQGTALPAGARIFDCWQGIVELVGGLPAQVREVKISETMRPTLDTGGECLGLWEPRERKELSSRGRNSLASLPLEEHCSTRSLTLRAGARMCSRDFESTIPQSLANCRVRARVNPDLNLTKVGPRLRSQNPNFYSQFAGGRPPQVLS